MRPPLAGKRAAARRLAEQVRRRLEPVERVLPVKLPGAGSAGASSSGAVRERARPAPGPEDAAARIDAARRRLRATIEPPAEREDADAEQG